MNSVHEPGSRTMSKNRLRNNTESIRIENRPSAPSAQPVARPGAQRPGRVPRAPLPRPAAPSAPCRASSHRAHVPATYPARPSRALRAHARACCVQRRVVAWQLAVSWPGLAVSRHSCLSSQLCPLQYTAVYCNTLSALQAPFSRNTVNCIAIQFCLSTNSTSLQYNICIATQFSSQPSILQYNFPATYSFSAIQYSVLQYKFFFFSQYNWAVAQNGFCIKKYIYIYISIILKKISTNSFSSFFFSFFQNT